jgi:hypothetical protein
VGEGWRCGSNGTAPAKQIDPEYKSHTTKRKKKYRNKLSLIWSVDFQQEFHVDNDTGATGYPDAKNEVRSLLYSIYKRK